MNTAKREGCFNQALITIVASQCLLHCGDHGMHNVVLNHRYVRDLIVYPSVCLLEDL